MNELTHIARLKNLHQMNSHVVVGPGDDTAVVTFDSRQEWLITSDMLIEGVHFTQKDTPPEIIGRKLIAVNLSDIAAMAGIPLLATVALAIPPGTSESYLDKITEGIETLAHKYGVAIVGGDTNSTSGPLTLSMSLIGKASEKGPLLRSTSRKGDSILVTGTLGGSRLGKHLNFTPRVEEALFLHRNYDLHAMIDLSDGIASDLRRLTEDFALGAELVKGAIPISAAIHHSPQKLLHALTDGEDFELLFTMPTMEAMKLINQQPLPNCTISRIGTVMTKPGLFWLQDDHSLDPEEISWSGYVHH
jgi:thiamine-monophosphate kinase